MVLLAGDDVMLRVYCYVAAVAEVVEEEKHCYCHHAAVGDYNSHYRLMNE